MKQVFLYKHQKSIIVTDAHSSHCRTPFTSGTSAMPSSAKAIICTSHCGTWRSRSTSSITPLSVMARDNLVSMVADYLARYDVHIDWGDIYFKTDLFPYLGLTT